MSVSKRPLPREDLRALEGYHAPQFDVSVRLNTNESPYGPPLEFVDAWLERLRDVPLNRYPDREARDLTDAIAARMSRDFREIFAANGSNEVLQTLLLTYGGPTRRALVFEPTYALHSHLARITGTALVVGERTPEFGIDVTSACALIQAQKPDIVFLCSPNNPSGTVDGRATIEAVMAVAPGLVIVDEAYGEFSDWTAADLVTADTPLVVVRTFSKVWSLAALRLGFCIAPPWIVSELERVRLPYHLNAATQAAGIVALEFGEQMEARVEMLVSERERLFTALAALDRISVFPSGANFLLFRVDGGGRALWEGLLERDVLIRDFSNWPRVEDCLRVTVGSPAENDLFLSAIGDALCEHGGP